MDYWRQNWDYYEFADFINVRIKKSSMHSSALIVGVIITASVNAFIGKEFLSQKNSFRSRTALVAEKLR
jgi:hypothetical protein